jgi:D-alanyl-D-alanine carboxypeptidase
MGWVKVEARHGLCKCIVVLAALAAALAITTNTADARYHRRLHFHFTHHHWVRVHHHAAARGYSPPTASIVIDGNTGAVLEESHPDALRHPASLTKVMTLYLLFERLQAGTIKFDTPLLVSAHAAAQAPTKLGLKPGETISVESAIKAIVTRSANDAAVVIAENLGGSEPAFARMMTQKARELGMNRTTYVNASGLPDDRQITTARDLAVLGRAIYERFPQYYHFFSTTSFVFRGHTIRGHDHLLGTVPGVDGIKTGFTDASGFNLMTSVHRDGRYLVAVVLGGRTAAERDAHMRALIGSNIRLAAVRHGPPVLAQRVEPSRASHRAAIVNHAEHRRESRRLPIAHGSSQAADPTPVATADPSAIVGSNAPIRPVMVKTIAYRAVTVRSPSMAAMPVLVPAAQAQPAAQTLNAQRAAIASAEKMPDVTPAPSVEPPPQIEAAKAQPVNSIPASAHDGWVIQIGAYGGENEARQHLSEAQAKLHAVLGAADPFTEPVQKGATTLYRARFAGFDRATAESACRQLKSHDFRCMMLKD